MTIIKNIDNKKVNYLVCVNNEPYSEVALHFACKLAKNNNGLVTILHVIEPSDYHSLGGVEHAMRSEKHDDAQKLLDTLSSKAYEWSGIVPIVLLKEGQIEDEIIEVVGGDETVNMMLVGAAPDGANKSKILPPLVSSLGTKFAIPMMIVPGNLSEDKVKILT